MGLSEFDFVFDLGGLLPEGLLEEEEEEEEEKPSISVPWILFCFESKAFLFCWNTF